MWKEQNTWRWGDTRWRYSILSDIRHFSYYLKIFTKVWYQSPYPEEYTVLPKIYICEFCLKYMKVVPCCELFKLKCTVYILWHLRKKNPNTNSTRRRVWWSVTHKSAFGNILLVTRFIERTNSLSLRWKFEQFVSYLSLYYLPRCVERSTSNTAKTFA